MFRIKTKNTVFQTSGVGTSTSDSFNGDGLTRIDEGGTDDTGDNNGDTGDGSGGGTGGGNITVQEVFTDPKQGGDINVTVTDVNTIQFDKSTGFHVTDTGDGTAYVELGSSFADIFIEGETTLEAEGEDELEIIAGDGMVIKTTTSHTGSAAKAITFSTANQGTYIIDGSDGSEDIPLFEDMINSASNYKGATMYLTGLGPTPRPDPFLWVDKFYFNEGGEWFESPFALGRLLND